MYIECTVHKDWSHFDEPRAIRVYTYVHYVYTDILPTYSTEDHTPIDVKSSCGAVYNIFKSINPLLL